MSKKIGDQLIVFNVIYFIILFNLICFKILTIWISFGHVDPIFTSIRTAENAVLFYKNQHYSLLILLIVAADLWYVVCLVVHIKYNNDEKNINKKEIFLTVKIFVTNLLLSVTTGIIISRKANELKTVEFGEKIYLDRAALIHSLDHVQFLSYIVFVILIIELIIILRKYYIKTRKTLKAMFLCGGAIIPINFLLLSLNY